jgi:hypothetical protein
MRKAMLRNNPEPQITEKPCAGQWLKNGWRLLISPVTQIFMTIGIFPAQTLSTIKKIPVLKSVVGFITRKLGNDSRSAAETFQEDFVKREVPLERSGLGGRLWNFFNRNPKAQPIDTSGLTIQNTQTPYTTNFGRQVALETFSFEHQSFRNLAPEDRYYRVHCGNNTANCSRFFIELATLSQRHPELKTITYNHSGVEGSGGVTLSQDDLINGLCAQVKELLKKGAKPENIELSGFSIGAATAALTAAKLRKEGIGIQLNKAVETNLYDDRTFATMGKVVTNGFPGLSIVFKILKTIPLLKELTEHVFQPLVRNLIIEPLLWLIDWNMDPSSAYQSISPERRALTVVKPQSKGQGTLKAIGKYFGKFTEFFKRGKGDKVIPVHVSLAAGTEDATEKAVWKKNLKALQEDIEMHAGQISNLELLDKLKPNNSISSDALIRLKLAAARNENVTDLVCLLKIGSKAHRFYGVTEANAHNTTSENLSSRVNPDEMKAALRAAGLDSKLPPNGVTLYSLHHQAVKQKNERDKKAVVSELRL